jgi:hypothetical protein
MPTPILSPDQLAEARRTNDDMTELNALLGRAGAIADRLNQKGYDVVMTLWHDTRGSDTVVGRLQGNVSKAHLRQSARGA